MTPLSLVFRVDATDDADARRQLTETIAVATRIRAALTPPTPAYSRPDVDDRDILGRPGTAGPAFPADAQTGDVHVHIDPTGKPIRRPWAPGQDGMGQ